MSQLITLQSLLSLSVFLAITLGVWGVLSAVADRPVTAEERLSRVLNPVAKRPDSSAIERQQDRIQEKVKEAASKLGQSLRSETPEAELGKVRLERCSTRGFGANRRWPSITA